MNKIAIIFVLLCSVSFSQITKEQIDSKIATGEFNIAEQLINTAIVSNQFSLFDIQAMLDQKEILSRIKKDFSSNQSIVLQSLKQYYPAITASDLLKWENDKSLEMKVINGEKKYFKSAVRNLFRLNKDAKVVFESKNGIAKDTLKSFLASYIPDVMNLYSQHRAQLFKPIRVKITYTLTVDSNAVPAGEILRCWLPYPRNDRSRQREIKLISVNSDEFILSDEKRAHRTIYFEKKAAAGMPTIFEIVFLYTSYGEINVIDTSMGQNWKIPEPIRVQYLTERAPHIVFSSQLKELSAKIIGTETNPIKKMKLIYTWISNNIPWASALEYSIINSLPEYCIENRHGDCGIQSMLFITLCRMNGIAAKWQSGWMLHPGSTNLHDWAEVYIPAFGWVPVDQSFGVQKLENEKNDYYFLGSTDNYHLIVNDDFGQPLFPSKTYLRSEPVDFQRGEVEWRGGNLYFDKWNYNMKVETGLISTTK